MAGEIRVGLVGFGLAGRAFHAPFVAANPRLRLTHVVQRTGSSARERYPDVAIVRDLGELLAESPAVDLVVIATPNATHAPLAERALRAGRHVVVDKPFTISSTDGVRLSELARASGRVLSVYQNRRWDGDFLTVSEILRQEWLGAPRRFESRLDRFRPGIREGAWREQPGPGAGLLFDLGPHLIDQALMLFGRPIALEARVSTERQGARCDDRFEITLHYRGIAAHLGAGMLADPPGARFRISGDRGVYEKHGVDPQEAPLRAGVAPGGPGWGEEPAEHWGVLAAAIGGLHVEGRVRTLAGNYGRFYENVCEAIENRAPLAVTAEQATDTIRLIELAFESSRRRTVIDC